MKNCATIFDLTVVPTSNNYLDDKLGAVAQIAFSMLQQPDFTLTEGNDMIFARNEECHFICDLTLDTAVMDCLKVMNILL